MTPNKITVKDKEYLEFVWSDNSESRIKLTNLRWKCPCAICSSENSEKGDKYFPIFSDEQLSINKISKIGNYAITISWKDGHETGIYEFGYLHDICEPVGENL